MYNSFEVEDTRTGHPQFDYLAVFLCSVELPCYLGMVLKGEMHVG